MATQDSQLLNLLPAELLHHIFTYLEPFDLIQSASCCRVLQTLAYDDRLWQSLLNENLPTPLSSPTPLNSFRELYAAHHPHWFLVKHRIWFGSTEPNGKLLISRFNASQGSVEAFQITAARGPHSVSFWEKDREVMIHSFDPVVSLDTHRPALRLVPNARWKNERIEGDTASNSRLGKEILMDTFSESGLYGSFMLCKELPSTSISSGTSVWPPLRFPAVSRTRNESSDGYSSTGHRPSTTAEVSTHNFRLRRWVQYHGRRAAPNVVSSIATSLGSLGGLTGLGFNGPYFSAALNSASGGGMNIRFPEDISTYATLDTACYTPTAEKPFQGIFVGDYSGHGPEFLLLLQPDALNERPLPEGMAWLREWLRFGTRRDSSSSERSFASAMENAVDSEHNLAGWNGDHEEGTSTYATELTQPVPSGRLEAIKLTGDPNIPRAEYTFIAPDIGDGGLVRIADEEIFRGARIVRSAGHIAGRGFREDQYTPTQLILIGHDRVAQLWEGFNHISYYQRVDIDALIELESSATTNDLSNEY